MGAKVEAIKAMARHVAAYTRTSPVPASLFHGGGQGLLQFRDVPVVNEAVQLFGGVGLTQEFPVEKLLRDARSMQIEDGETNILFMHFGFLMTQLNRENAWGRV